MNEPRVRAVPIYNGWEGQFRKIDKAGWHTVCENGEPRLFDTSEQATIAAYEAMNAHHFGQGILRDGERASAAVSEAEKKFKRIFRGGGKTVAVERR